MVIPTNAVVLSNPLAAIDCVLCRDVLDEDPTFTSNVFVVILERPNHLVLLIPATSVAPVSYTHLTLPTTPYV